MKASPSLYHNIHPFWRSEAISPRELVTAANTESWYYSQGHEMYEEVVHVHPEIVCEVPDVALSDAEKLSMEFQRQAEEAAYVAVKRGTSRKP